MGTIVVRGWAFTDQPTEGRLRAADKATLLRMAEDIRTGKVPLLEEHDSTRRREWKVTCAEVRTTPAGNNGVWVEFVVDEDEWHSRPFRALSVSILDPEFYSDMDPSKPSIAVFTDAEHFPGSLREVIADELSDYFNVVVGSIHQYSAEVLATVAIILGREALVGIPIGLLVNALYDVIKTRLLKTPHGKMSNLNFRIDDKTKQVDGVGVELSGAGDGFHSW